jgi:creatinine amidohydrolase
MLALAPDLVRRELIVKSGKPPDAETIRAVIFDRGTTWPWRTDDPRLAREGVIGDAAAATAELGTAIVDSVVAESRGVFVRLLENQKRVHLGESRSR